MRTDDTGVRKLSSTLKRTNDDHLSWCAEIITTSSDSVPLILTIYSMFKLLLSVNAEVVLTMVFWFHACGNSAMSMRR